MIRMFVMEYVTTWDEHLGAVLFAYRNAAHSANGISHARILFGKDLRAPLYAEVDLYMREFNKGRKDDYIWDHAKALERDRRIAMEKLDQQLLAQTLAWNQHNQGRFRSFRWATSSGCGITCGITLRIGLALTPYLARRALTLITCSIRGARCEPIR